MCLSVCTERSDERFEMPCNKKQYNLARDRMNPSISPSQLRPEDGSMVARSAEQKRNGWPRIWIHTNRESLLLVCRQAARPEMKIGLGWTRVEQNVTWHDYIYERTSVPSDSIREKDSEDCFQVCNFGERNILV